VHPPPGHAEEAAKLRHGQQVFGEKRVLSTWSDGLRLVRPSAVGADALGSETIVWLQ
jgi:hypothetical protein